MDGTFLTRAERYAGAARRRRRRLRTVTVLASLVVFCTTYALILPAITMEHICGMTEHTHTVDCYTQLLPPKDPEAVCGLVENEVHRHGPECYDTGLAAPDALTCENTDPDHVHGPLCYGTWQLTCPLPEHLHDESCNADAAPLETAEPTVPEAVTEAEPTDETSEPPETLLTELLSLFNSSGSAASVPVPLADGGTEAVPASDVTRTAAVVTDTDGSGRQIDRAGGTATSGQNEEQVKVSKTIAGTDIENVFDITLTVQTPQKIDQIVQEPDMAVVLVMDISNTMKYKFGTTTVAGAGETSKYNAAISAATDFLNNFASNNTLGVSKVGFVAFNTDAHKIFDLQKCTGSGQVNTLMSTVKSRTQSILDTMSSSSSNRFTNMEAGLKMARDMLAGVSNQNKFVIFLTDGFPTTYVKSDYTGYNPIISKVTAETKTYLSDALFPEKPFTYGTNYSDRSAVKARQMATQIKNSGIAIFSIGVDVSGQNLETYINQSAKNTFTTMDRTGSTYDIGGKGDGAAFKSWLGNSIGSGYQPDSSDPNYVQHYYDSNNTAQLQNAYQKIFEQIKLEVAVGSQPDWVATDPIPPLASSPPGQIELIGLFDKNGTLTSGSLSGSFSENAENTAGWNTTTAGDAEIKWDLKRSGYTSGPCTFENGGTGTLYTFSLRYRVRLKNEDNDFIERYTYNTNGTTTLRYRIVRSVNNNVTISPPISIDFPIPAVHGFLGELTFSKKDGNGGPVAGAEFTLSHAGICDKCHGDGSPVDRYDNLSDKVVSDENGIVAFDKIPSGHIYDLTETDIPDGYAANGSHYRVTVAYDTVTVQVYDCNWQPIPDGWADETIINTTYYELPATGGSGTLPYTLGGLSLLALAGTLFLRRRRREAGT